MPTIAVISSLSTNKCDVSKRGDNLLICIGIFIACISYFFVAVIKHFGQRNLRTFICACCARGRREHHDREARQKAAKGSESFQLEMQAENKISKLAVVKGFNIKVRLPGLTYSTQLQLLNLLKEHHHVRTKYSKYQEYRGHFSLKPQFPLLIWDVLLHRCCFYWLMNKAVSDNGLAE